MAVIFGTGKTPQCVPVLGCVCACVRAYVCMNLFIYLLTYLFIKLIYCPSHLEVTLSDLQSIKATKNIIILVKYHVGTASKSGKNGTQFSIASDQNGYCVDEKRMARLVFVKILPSFSMPKVSLITFIIILAALFYPILSFIQSFSWLYSILFLRTETKTV